MFIDPNINYLISRETTVLKRISYCAILNGAIFLTSILFFEYAFLPFMRLSILFVFGKDADGSGQSIWLWIEVILRITFQSIWVVPIFALTKFVNNLWFQVSFALLKCVL